MPVAQHRRAAVCHCGPVADLCALWLPVPSPVASLSVDVSHCPRLHSLLCGMEWTVDVSDSGSV